MTRLVAVAGLFAVGLVGVLRADDQALKELAGKYQGVGLVKHGADDPATAKEMTAAVAGDTLTITVKGKSHKATVAVDPTKKPAHIDISPADGPEKGKTFPGIYKVEKGVLHLLFAERGDRPAEFKGGDQAVYLKLKKADGK